MNKIAKWVGHWNVFEIIWLLLFSTVAVIITIVSKDNFFGFTVFLSGVVCVVLVAKGNILNYIIGLYNTLGYAWIAWHNGLFGEVFEYLLFYLPMTVVGFFLWRNKMQDGTVLMRKLHLKWILLLLAIIISATGIVGYLLSLIEAQNTPYIDAATNVLSVLATILMVLRYREQWGAYILLNVLSIIMWLFRAVDGSPEAAIMIVMWSAFLVNSFYGFYNWTKGAKETEGAA